MYDDRATALSSQAFRERRLWRSMRRTTDPQRSTRRIRNSYREKYRTIVNEESRSQAIRTSEFLRVRVIAVRNVDKSKVTRSLVSTPRWTLCRPSCRLSLSTSLSRWRLLPPKPLEKWPTNEDVAVQVGFISDWKQCGSHCFVTHDAAVCKNVETLWYRLNTKERSTMMASTPKSDKHGGKFSLRSTFYLLLRAKLAYVSFDRRRRRNPTSPPPTSPRIPIYLASKTLRQRITASLDRDPILFSDWNGNALIN